MLYHKNNFNNEIPSKPLDDFRNSVNEVTGLIEEYTGILINPKESIIYESVESGYEPEHFNIDVPSGRISEINKSIRRAGYKLISESKSDDGEIYKSRFIKDGKNGTVYIITFSESSSEYDDENDSESYIEAVCLNDTIAVRESLLNDSKYAIDEGIMKGIKNIANDIGKDSFENGNIAIKYMRRYRTKHKNIPEDFRKTAISIGKKFSQLPIGVSSLIKTFSDSSSIERRIAKLPKKRIKNYYEFGQRVPVSKFKASDTSDKLKQIFTREGFQPSKLGSHFFYKNGPKGVIYFGQYAFKAITTATQAGNVTIYSTEYWTQVRVYCIDDDGDIKSYITTGKLINGDRMTLFAAKRSKNK